MYVMPILTPRDEAAVRKEFERIAGPVKLVVFSQELMAPELCQQNEQLVREVAELSDQITVEVLNLAIDRERAETYGVDQVPALVVEATEFPELSRAYQVMGVPKVVINDRVQFEGALPEHEFLGAVLQAVETI